ncbi:MAG: mercuric transporter MerT family protein [Bacteroidota bacterium]
MEQSKMTTVGSVAAAIIASLCCIGPVAVALIGVGGIGAFAVFEPYRPYLIALTVALLGIAFYLTYRKREVICEDGTCKIESASKWNKSTVWLAAVLAVVTIAFPYFDITNAATAQALLSESSQQTAAIAVLDIEGMDCRGCAKGLEATLGNLKGVKKAAVEFEEGRAVIEYDPTKVKPEQLVASVDETGFKARISLTKTTQRTVNN